MALVKKCRHGRQVPPARRPRAWRACDCTWYADIRDDGRRRYIPLGPDYRAARLEHDRLVREQQRLTPQPPDGRSFIAVSERWLASRSHLRPGTLHGYRCALDHSRRYLGSIDVNQVTSALLAEMEGAMIAAGLSPLYARNVRSVAVMVLGHAADGGLIASVPRPRRRPQARRVERPFLTPAQLAAVWAIDLPATDSIGRRRRYAADYRSMFQIAALTGMRIGELLALVDDDVDHAVRVARVRRGLDSRTGRIGELKTRAARRDVDLPDEALALFPDGPGRLWPTTYSSALNAWHELLRGAGLPECGTHVLRHSNAAARLMLGQDLPYIAAQLGHAGPEVTLREYGHLIPRPRADAGGLSIMLHGDAPSP